METIKNLNDSTLSALRALAVALRDSQMGLTEAANKVQDKRLVKLLYRIAGDRAEMEFALSDFIQVNAAAPPDATSWAGDLRTVWIKIRSAVSGGDTEVVLALVERSEQIVVGIYKKLLLEIAGSPLNRVLLRQYQRVREGCDAVVALRARYRESKNGESKNGESKNGESKTGETRSGESKNVTPPRLPQR